ncbi:hypothetical protein B0E43_12530 [Algoriphagus sp. A40]|nr:hypothetical protein B0E43_12530 [Algoriphagus sp. A40]
MHTKYPVFVFLCLVLGLASCAEVEEGPDNQAKINNVIPPEFVQTVKDLGMDVFPGNTPPDVTGTYFMIPNLMLRSNITGDVPSNTAFVTYNVTFSYFNEEDFSIRFVGLASGERDESESAVISGSGNNFTVYGRSTTTVGSNSVVLGVMYSGTIEDEKVKNLKRAIIVIDDSKGGPTLMKKGNSRVFHDGDKSS